MKTKNIIQKKSWLMIIMITICFGGNLEAQPEAYLVDQCVNSECKEVVYLKDFVVKLDGNSLGEREEEFVTTMVLSKNTEYKFSLCNAETSGGIPILRLLDNNNLLGSTYNAATGKMYNGFNFKCQRTGVYHMKISFQDGKPGYAVGILSYVKSI